MAKRMDVVPGDSLVGTIRRARMAMRLLNEPVEFVWNDGQVLTTKVDETFLDCVHRMQAEIRAAAIGPKQYRSKETLEVFFLNDDSRAAGKWPEWVGEKWRESKVAKDSHDRYVLVDTGRFDDEGDRVVDCLLESEFLADYEPVDG